jgi:hypothetical protein
MTSSPWRFILIKGVLQFGGLTAATLIIFNFWHRGDLHITVGQIFRHIVLGAVGGFLWASVLWLSLQIAERRRRS